MEDFDELVKQKTGGFGVVNSEEEVYSLLDSMGIFVYPFRGKRLRGWIIQDDGGPVMIAVNQNLSYIDRIMVLLHELGHYVLHGANILSWVFVDRGITVNRFEREADIFAWCLMSENLRKLYIEEKGGLPWAE